MLSWGGAPVGGLTFLLPLPSCGSDGPLQATLSPLGRALGQVPGMWVCLHGTSGEQGPFVPTCIP